MSRERENPEQSCLLGWQEKPAPSCTARCLPRPGSHSPAQTGATYSLPGLHFSWVLRASRVCTTSRGALGPLPVPAPISLGQARRAFPCLCCTQHLTADLQFAGQAWTMGTCCRSFLAAQRPACLYSHTQASQLMQTLQPHQPAEKATHRPSWAPLWPSQPEVILPRKSTLIQCSRRQAGQ